MIICSPQRPAESRLAAVKTEVARSDDDASQTRADSTHPVDKLLRTSCAELAAQETPDLAKLGMHPHSD